MTKDQLSSIPTKQFGLPKERKFPMQDEKHLKAAIAYFYTAVPAKRKELADNIVRRYGELKSKIKISKKNPLFKFVPDEMKNLNESSSLFENVNVDHFGQMFGPKGKEITESLLAKTGLSSVDDIDAQVPADYRPRQLLINTIKSYILNEMGDNYPIVYTDYLISTKDLQGNNGGIRTLSETSVLLDYRSYLNESTTLNVVKDMDHIQFCAVLREWDEGYTAGHRNPTYDRLMIESWKHRVNALLTENAGDSEEGSQYKIKAEHHADIETKQKLIDLGVKDPKEFNKNYVVGDGIDEKSPIHKSAEIGFNIAKNILDKNKDAGEDSDVVDSSLSLKLYTYKDDVYIPQKGKDVTFEDLWRLD
jgi:hypothetical protein